MKIEKSRIEPLERQGSQGHKEHEEWRKRNPDKEFGEFENPRLQEYHTLMMDNVLRSLYQRHQRILILVMMMVISMWNYLLLLVFLLDYLARWK